MRSNDRVVAAAEAERGLIDRVSDREAVVAAPTTNGGRGHRTMNQQGVATGASGDGGAAEHATDGEVVVAITQGNGRLLGNRGDARCHLAVHHIEVDGEGVVAGAEVDGAAAEGTRKTYGIGA